MTRTHKILVSLPPAMVEQAVRDLIVRELQVIEAVKQRLKQKGKP